MSDDYFQPQSGNAMPRFAGIATMMRLPQAASAAGLDACFVGVPFDLGTSNRTGARFGPRQIRSESVLLRPYNMATRAAPFDSLRVADLGDVATNPYNLADSIARIEAAYHAILAHGCRPVTLGGDHTITLPILRAKKALADMESGQILKVLATDPGSQRDFAAFAKQTGNEIVESSTTQDKTFVFLMRRR